MRVTHQFWSVAAGGGFLLLWGVIVGDPVYLVGERALLADLGDLADVTRPVDATGDPEDALEDAVHSFWTVRLRAV